MKFVPKTTLTKKNVGKFQQGGPVEDPAMAVDEAVADELIAADEVAGGDPLMQIAQVFMQGLQTQDCNMLAQGAQMFLQLVQQTQGGAGAAPEGEPVFRKGGVLVRRIKK